MEVIGTRSEIRTGSPFGGPKGGRRRYKVFVLKGFVKAAARPQMRADRGFVRGDIKTEAKREELTWLRAGHEPATPGAKRRSPRPRAVPGQSKGRDYAAEFAALGL